MRIAELDSLRGISILLMALYHYTWYYDFTFHLFGPGRIAMNYGEVGVQIFFIICGYLMFLTLERTESPIDFIISKFARLFPIYWCCMAITLTVLSLFPLPGFPPVTFKDIVINLPMIQYFANARLVDGVYWSLAYVVVFYGLMLGIFVLGILRFMPVVSLFWLLMSSVSYFYGYPLKKYIDILFILEYAPLFVAGLSFYLIKKGAGGMLQHLIVAASFGIRCFWLYAERTGELYHIKLLTPLEVVPHYVTLLLGYLVFYLFVHNKLSFLRNKVLLFLGGISFSFYLLHNLIGFVVIQHLSRWNESQFFYLPLTFLSMLGLAYVVNRFIEQPSNMMVKNALYKLFNPAR